MSTRPPQPKQRKVSLTPGTELVVRARHGGVVVVIEGEGELEITRSPEAAGSESAKVQRPRDLRIERALAAVRADPARHFGVRDLAKIAGASPSTFLRLFVRHVGTTPGAWLAAERLELARSLLAETDRGLADIASQTGYASEFGLSRAFKRHFGIAPSVLRRASVGVRAPVRCAA
jgi:transcriptional regulator GlxA family with amidase domain